MNQADFEVRDEFMAVLRSVTSYARRLPPDDMQSFGAALTTLIEEDSREHEFREHETNVISAGMRL